jgi:alpha-2-macroglobulin
MLISFAHHNLPAGSNDGACKTLQNKLKIMIFYSSGTMRFFGSKTSLHSMIIVLLLVVLSVSCSRGRTTADLPEPEFHPMIRAFTSGTVSALSPVRIILSQNVPFEVEPMSEADGGLFRFSPALPGKAYWTDNRTIEFRPDKRMENGKTYNVRFRVSELFDLPSGQANFDFSIRTVPMDIIIKAGTFISEGSQGFTWNRLGGELLASDVVDPRDARAY